MNKKKLLILIIIIIGAMFISWAILKPKKRITVVDNETCKTTIYESTYKKAPTKSNTKYDVTIWTSDNSNKGGNSFVTIKTEFEEQLNKFSNLNDEFTSNQGFNNIKEAYNEDFFRNYNLSMIFHNMFRGTFEVTSVVTENEKAVINVSGDNLSNTSVKDRRIIFVKFEKT